MMQPDSSILSDAAVVDAMPPDASVPPEPDPIENPLDLDHDALFQCDDGVVVQTAPRIWRLNARQFDHLMTSVIRDDYRTTLRVSNPYDGLHSGQQFSNPANAFGMDEPTFELIMQTADSVAQHPTGEAGILVFAPLCSRSESRKPRSLLAPDLYLSVHSGVETAPSNKKSPITWRF